MTAPFALPAEDEDLRELEELGLRAAPDGALEPVADSAQISAAASRLLRAIIAVERERATTRAAMQAELALIEQCYLPQLGASDRRIAYLEGRVQELARMADSIGALEKKKTISVAYGSFGKRQVPERVEVIDDARVLAWAKAHAPELVDIVTKERVLVKPLASWLRIAGTGEIPDGVEIHAPREEYVVKPNAGGTAS